MGIMNYGDVGSLRQAVDPAMFGADVSGTADSRSAWQRAIDYAVAMASRNGGVVHIKPSPGTYLINWDGASGYNITGGATTGLNYRFCFVINALVSTAVERVIFDFTGCYLIHGGTDWTDWASMFLVIGAEYEVIGGTYDYDNLPFTQGTVTGRGTGYIDFQVDSDFDEAAPAFAQVFEIVRHSSASYVLANPEGRYATRLCLDVDAYTGTAKTLTAQGAGVYRIGGLSGAEDTLLAGSGYCPDGAMIVVKGATDGPAWFNGILCPRTSIKDATCHASAENFYSNTLSLNHRQKNVRCIPRPGSNALAVTMRDAFDNFDCGGHIEIIGGEIYGSGDDAIAIQGSTLANFTYVDADEFDAYSTGHFYGTPPIGTHFILYDATHTEIAAGSITAIGAHQSGYIRRYTVSLSSGALPADMSDHIAPLVEYQPTASVQFPKVHNIRGRFVYSGAPGEYNILGYNCTDEGVLIQPSKGGNTQAYTGGSGYKIGGIIYGACRATFYPAAIRVFASTPSDSGGTTSTQLAALNTPYKDVKINAMIENCNGMAVLLGGVDTFDLSGMVIKTVCQTAPYSGAEAYDMGFTSKTVVGIVNCSNGVPENFTVQGINSAALSTAITHNGGSNTKITSAQRYINHDLSTLVQGVLSDFGVGTIAPSYRGHFYKSGAAAEVMIENDGSSAPRLRMKNATLEMSFRVSTTSMIISNETGAVDLFSFSPGSNPGFNPTTDNIADIGYGSAMYRRIFSGLHVFRSYTVTEANALSTPSTGVPYIHVSNGNAGQPCLAWWNGSAWKVVVTGATISAT